MDQDTKHAFIEERRSYERIVCDYAGIVRGRFSDGKKFEEIVKVLNLSAGGAYFTINRNVEVGQILTVKISFPTGSLDYGSSTITTRAIVIRTELYAEGVMGVGIQFLNFRFY
jgi:hypothetical protein